MLEAAIHSSVPRHGARSVSPSTQKKHKSQTSDRRKKTQLEVTLWYCCFCNYGPMTFQVPKCVICERGECSNGREEKFKVDGKEQKQALYTSNKDAALRKQAALFEEAALLGLATAKPELVQPPDPRNATTAITCTTLEPDPTYDQEGLPWVSTPTHVTRQSLIEHTPHSREDIQGSSTARPRMEFGLPSLSVNPVDATDIAPDPPSFSCSTHEQASDWPSSLSHQTDTIDTCDTVSAYFNSWTTETSNKCHGWSSPRNTVPPSSNQPNQSTTRERFRKRTSDQGTASKKSGAKRPKVSNNAVPQPGKGDKRLLACPFWKKDPIRHRDCFRGVKRIRDVKQHLRRSHKQPVFCPICGMEFGDVKAALSEHLRAAERCQKREFPEPDGINAEHQKALNRYSDRSSDQREQWYVIWDYLFPGGRDGKSPPRWPSSPYVDQELSEDLSSYLHFSRRKGWRILANSPGMSDVAFHLDEELLQRCLDTIHDAWQAERSNAVQPTWEESPPTLSDASSPEERVRTGTAVGVCHEPDDDSMLMMTNFAQDSNDFSGLNVDGLFDNFMNIPNTEDDITHMFPSIPLLTCNHGGDRSIEVATLDPTLINR